MLRYIIKRLIHLIPVLIVISMVLFAFNEAMPGNPVDLLMPKNLTSESQKAELRAVLEERYNLNGSLPERYIGWIGRVLKGELGESTKYQRPVKDVLGTPLRNTFILNLPITIISLFLSIVVGIKSAVRQGSFYDKFWQVFSLAGISLPTFFSGMILIFVFALNLGWLPPGNMPVNNTVGEWAKHLVLPSITLLIGSLATTSRYVRNSMIDALSQDYVRTARAKGLNERKVIYSHAFRNALIPVVTVVAWNIVGMFSGAAVTETLFAYQGIGKYFIDSIISQDYNVIMALNMMYAILNVLGNLLMDIGYSLADPRVRLE
ncbi:ABC transporter permease [Neofamilia massiliensis]|uniref:ABC transporter permease n=1 Tax=Neofamilia massiliensis TaxID=1673724 RepID=UPI0006BB6EF5|nr:ABC transporter permease [Neofamilia massiliensis]